MASEISLQVITRFRARELLNAFKLAKASGLRFFHLRGDGGKLCLCDLSEDATRVLKITFPKETGLAWEGIHGIIEVKYGFRDLNRLVKLRGDFEVIYGEFNDDGLSFGCLLMDENGGQTEVYREAGTFRCSYTATAIEAGLRLAGMMTMEPSVNGPSFRVGAKTFLNALKNLEENLVVLASDGSVTVQGVEYRYVDSFLKYGRTIPLGIRANGFKQMYERGYLVNFLNAFSELSDSGVLNVTINDKGRLIAQGVTPLGSVLFVVGNYVIYGQPLKNDGA